MHLEGSAVTGRRLRVTSRTSACLPEQSEVSFGAYFNAFAAGYWRHWTPLTEVHLKLRLEGSGRVDVYRCKAEGARIHERGVVLGAHGVHEVDVALDLRPFEDGGWYWFDLTTDDDALTLHEGGWHAAGRGARPGRGDDRDADVQPARRLRRDAHRDRRGPAGARGRHPGDPPDQGTRKVRDEPGFAAAEAALGGRLRIIDQPNLGGSGGYARVMYEALATPETQQILFMDDDILLEPDSVLRAVAFSRYAREPMLVGGQMLSLQARSQLSTMGEVVDRHKFLWRNAPQTEPHHDLAERTLRTTPWLHRRCDVDYNAWWMCLIPRVVAEDLGLPLPLFIKWDDAEYGLRARARGYRTATVPGIAIWHMSFLEKDDTSDWQAYFHYRNRLVAAALHGPDDPKALLTDILKRTVRHLMLMEYSAVALQHKALRDFLAGPGGAVPEPGDGAGAGPRDAGGVRRRPPARLGDAGAAEQPGRAGGAGVPGAPDHEAGDPHDAGPQRRPQPARARPGAPGGAAAQRFVAAGAVVRALPGWTRRRSRPRTAAASPSAAATRSCSAGSCALGPAAAGDGPRVAGPAPPLPRGGAAPHEPRGLEADLRGLTLERPEARPAPAPPTGIASLSRSWTTLIAGRAPPELPRRRHRAPAPTGGAQAASVVRTP